MVILKERIRFDTESIGFLGATMMIQWATQDKPDDIHLHDIFDVPVIETLNLIQRLSESVLVGYNLAHDMFHLSRTLNCFLFLDPKKPPNPYEYANIEREIYTKDYCVKPFGAVDLMLIGKRGKFQSMMKQKPIIIKRTPKRTADQLVDLLQKEVPIGDQYFAKNISKGHSSNDWKIQELQLETSEPITPQQKKAILEGKSDLEIDPDFVNVRLDFHPSASLKDAAKYHLGFTDTEAFETYGSSYDEKSWYPCSGEWVTVFNEHYHIWKNDKKKRDYARRDVVYTAALDNDFGCPPPDRDSMLACMVGNTHWSGYAIDIKEAVRQRDEAKIVVDKTRAEINYNSPQQVLTYLHEVCSKIEQFAVKNTRKETVKACLASDNEALRSRASLILNARDKEMELRVLERIIIARRLYVTFNVSGTTTNRMSGGDAVNKQRESINPQGIKKGTIRKLFTFADKAKGEILSNGDFKGYEVAIYDAVFPDPKLHEELLSGQKIHAIWGSYLYGKTYTEILKTEKIKATEPDGYYSRSKNSFFAGLYGAQPDKIAEITWLDKEEAEEALDQYLENYPTIKRTQEQDKEDHTCMVQAGGIGTRIVWREPKKIVESFLGFKRSFELEYYVVERMFKLTNKVSKKITKTNEHVIRRDRVQTVGGALMSSLFAACFNVISSVIRVAGNFKIQSPGGEMTKIMQYNLTEVQPVGINEWRIKLFNVHDELQCVHHPEDSTKIKQIVNDFVTEYQEKVPLLAIDWNTGVDSWYEK